MCSTNVKLRRASPEGQEHHSGTNLSLIGRFGDIVTVGITTAVVMVVAGISPEHTWKEPILRLIDTVIGIAVGMVGAWIGLKVIGPGEGPHLGKSGAYASIRVGEEN